MLKKKKKNLFGVVGILFSTENKKIWIEFRWYEFHKNAELSILFKQSAWLFDAETFGAELELV